MKIWSYVLVFLLGAAPFLEAYAVIPLAIVAGLAAVPVMLLGLIGNVLTILLVVIFVDKIKQWRKNRKTGQEQEGASKRSARARKIWEKYGLPGLALIGPLVVGSHLTALMSLSLGGTKQKTAFWVIASIVIWTLVFTILIYLGIDFITDKPSFFSKNS